VLSLSCDGAHTTDPRNVLEPCPSDRGLSDALCGTLRVYENRVAKTGRTIDISIVVLPAHEHGAHGDPLFFLAGGPGQGAAQLASQLQPMLAGVQRERDIVLVDQRGTGRSGPLDCEDESVDALTELGEPEEQSLARLRRCLEKLDADPRLYTTSIAMDDLEEVRAHLGYETINLYGVSYGTRAALAYLRQHERRVRSVVLDGVAPTFMGLPTSFGRDGQRALDALVAACEGDTGCGAQHPRLGERIEALVRSLDADPRELELVHPRTAERVTIRVDARIFVHVLHAALYAPLVGALLPDVIARAERGQFESLFALALANEGAAGKLAIGMQLSVVCSEDATAPKQEHTGAESAVFGERLLGTLMRACEFWPRGELPPGYHEQVRSSVPTLVLSGELDPVTPPSWGEAVLPGLERSRHVVLRSTGHGAMTTACGRKLVRDFVARGNADALDASCAETITRPPFFAGPFGPDPTASPARRKP
jgi:pimeloyl-ACP methyl ester carboxylesterase